jgi:hypothetical protein
MALKSSMVLQAVDRVTAPARRVRTAVGGMTSGIRQFAQQMRRTSQDVQSGARSLEYYQTRARRMREVALKGSSVRPPPRPDSSPLMFELVSAIWT